jgi:hypothetical protein
VAIRRRPMRMTRTMSRRKQTRSSRRISRPSASVIGEDGRERIRLLGRSTGERSIPSWRQEGSQMAAPWFGKGGMVDQEAAQLAEEGRGSVLSMTVCTKQSRRHSSPVDDALPRASPPPSNASLSLSAWTTRPRNAPPSSSSSSSLPAGSSCRSKRTRALCSSSSRSYPAGAPSESSELKTCGSEAVDDSAASPAAAGRREDDVPGRVEWKS